MSTITTSKTVTNTGDTTTLQEEFQEDLIRHRVFFNHVDSFNVKHIAAFLTDQVFGASRAFKGNEEAAEEEQNMPAFSPEFAKNYEIIGTLRYPFHKPSEDILKVIMEDDDNFFEEICKCGFVICDITEDPDEIPKVRTILDAIQNKIENVKAVGPKTFAKWEETRTFILLSTVLTWAKSKPIDRNDPTIAFTEADYKRRKPHPNYQRHIDLEKEVILRGRKYRDKLKTYVIATGIPYGQEEEDLDFLFKMAWKNEKYMPIIGDGKNFVPLIHIEDLAKVIHGVCENTPSQPQYILAVEQTSTILKKIISALSKALGSGKTKFVTTEEALLLQNITQAKFDKCTVNLNMEPGYIIEELEIEWKNDLNLSENMKAIVQEFRISHNLVPIRIFIHGPPASGKTSLANVLSHYYGSHYISVKSAIDETLEDLRDRIEREKERKQIKEGKMQIQTEAEDMEEAEMGEEEEEEDEDEVDINELMEEIRALEFGMEESVNGKLPDEQVLSIMKKILSLNCCQNQGYVLDAYPKTTEQAKLLFGGGGEKGEEIAGEDEGDARDLLPNVIITLKATDDFLCERLMVLKEQEVQGTHYSEESMFLRLEDFRARNTEENTVLNYFDEQEIPIITVDVMDEAFRDPESILRIIIEKIGAPKSLALTPEEEAEIIALEEEKKRLEAVEKQLEEELLQKEAIECYQVKMEQWTSLLEQFQLEEEKMLAAECEPLRHYLMKYVFPTLSRGLIQTATVKPLDPVDFLAEFLFKENPEGRMFDPSYSRDGEHKLEACTCAKCCEDEDSEDTPC